MRIASGTVKAGHVVVDGEPLPDGSLVTVLVREQDETFELDAAAEAELLASLAEADRGELLPSSKVIGALRSRH